MPAATKKKTTKNTAFDVKSTASANTQVNRPAWPPFEPAIPKEDLLLRQLIPGQIVTISPLWSSTLCKKYVNFLSGLPLVTTNGTPKRGDAVRVNDRYQIDDPDFAKALWETTGVKDLVLNAESEDNGSQELWGGQVLGLNPNIRIYRYRKGQFFDQHYDDSNNLTYPSTPPVAARTTWTLLLYLTSSSSGCVGGETVFYPDLPAGPKKARKDQVPPEPIVVALETGMALFHKHGRDCMLHEGREVLDGEKWVIRSDLCVKR